MAYVVVVVVVVGFPFLVDLRHLVGCVSLDEAFIYRLKIISQDLIRCHSRHTSSHFPVTAGDCTGAGL